MWPLIKTLQSHFASVVYVSCSAVEIFLSKSIVSSYDFNFPFTIMGGQMVAIILVLKILKMTGAVSVPDYTYRSGKAHLAQSFGFAASASLSLMALNGMKIPMFIAIEHCIPLLSLSLSVVLLLKPLPSLKVVSSVLMVTIGCLIAGLGDLAYDGSAYTTRALSIFIQGLYICHVQWCTKNKSSTTEILKIYSYNTFIPLLFLGFLCGEFNGILKSRYITDPTFIIVLSLLLMMRLLLDLFYFCIDLNSAVTTNLIDIPISIFQTVTGFFVFGGVKYHPANIIGIVLNTFGFIFFLYAEGEEKVK